MFETSSIQMENSVLIRQRVKQLFLKNAKNMKQLKKCMIVRKGNSPSWNEAVLRQRSELQTSPWLHVSLRLSKQISYNMKTQSQQI